MQNIEADGMVHRATKRSRAVHANSTQVNLYFEFLLYLKFLNFIFELIVKNNIETDGTLFVVVKCRILSLLLQLIGLLNFKQSMSQLKQM